MHYAAAAIFSSKVSPCLPAEIITRASLSMSPDRMSSIARALANDPRIILADEPTAALDSVRAGIVMDLLRRLAAEQQPAIIAVTHDEKIFDRFDRIFKLRDGLLVDIEERAPGNPKHSNGVGDRDRRHRNGDLSPPPATGR